MKKFVLGVMICLSVISTNSFAEAIDYEAKYKEQVAVNIALDNKLNKCILENTELKEENKFLKKEARAKKHYILPFGLFGVTVDHFQGFVVGAVVTVIIL